VDTVIEQGGCLCRGVRYQVSGQPRSSSICHCRSCRMATGAGSVVWSVFEHNEFRLVSGQLSTYQSTPRVLRGFCARCGTSLTYHDGVRRKIDMLQGIPGFIQNLAERQRNQFEMREQAILHFSRQRKQKMILPRCGRL